MPQNDRTFTIEHIIGTHEYAAQYLVQVFEDGERVAAGRFYVADYDSTPAYSGAEDAAYEYGRMHAAEFRDA